MDEQYVNEKHFAEKLLNFDNNMITAQNYIKEHYNINSEYDSSDDTLYIWSNMNESKNLNNARNYILEKIGEDFVDVIFGKKLMD